MYRLLILSVLFACQALATDVGKPPHFPGSARTPRIAIIIDDLGDQRDLGERSVALPGPVAMSILPHTPFGSRLARSAHANGKEVLLHLPLEADRDLHPGPGVLNLDMNRQLFDLTLRMNLAALPHIDGVNNHMGSRMTRQSQPMHWLMTGLAKHDLFFVDSVTTGASVAYRVASEHGLPVARRNVFLDHDRNPAEIAYQFRRLVTLARRQGFAVGIGHPHPETLELLERELPRLNDLGLELVPVSQLLWQVGEPASQHRFASAAFPGRKIR